MSTTVEPVAPSLGRRILAPRTALVDERLHIQLVGFEPFQTVVVRAALQTKRHYWWESHVAFQADGQGTIDLSSDKPQLGTYENVDPMGLFWSMSPQSPTDMESIAALDAPPPKGTVRLVAEVDGQVVAWTDIARKGISPKVTVTRVRDNGLAGVFFRPTGQGPFPAVLVLSGSGGGIMGTANFGALLASHGFAVLALAYFCYEHLPEDLANIPLEYFEKAIAWLASRVDIQPGTLGVLGMSRGGELALILGATFPEIARVVAYVPSDRVNGGFGKRMSRMVSPIDSGFWANAWIPGSMSSSFMPPAWLWHGKSLPYTTIPVERIQGPVLLISGKNDMVWPSTEMCERIIKRLEEYKHPFPYKHLSHDHAGHRISFPYVPTCITHLAHPVAGVIVRFGGTAAGNAFASQDSWRQVLQFLEDGS